MAMSCNPASYSPSIFRGKISKVVHPDQNATRQTLVDLYMYDSMPLLYAVPVMASKIDAFNGAQQTPETGDVVVVGFLSGRMSDPVVLGFLPVANNPVQATYAQAPHYKRVQNGTTETIDRDGNRIIHIAADETVTIVGDGSVTIGGTLSVTVTGPVNITSPLLTLSGHAEIGSGASGTFTSKTGQVITVQNGITVDIN